MERDAPKLGFYAENRGEWGVKSVILARKTASHPMGAGRNRVWGGRRSLDFAQEFGGIGIALGGGLREVAAGLRAVAEELVRETE